MSGPLGCPPVPPERPVPPVADSPTPAGATRLIRVPTDKVSFTSNQECDARTALSRGLKEYLEGLSIDMLGKTVKFERVFESWAEPEDEAVYPSAAVYTVGDGDYDASCFSPNVNPRFRTPDGRYIVAPSELKQGLTIEVWTNSPEERYAIVAMLEAGLSPVEWMYGCRLELPHYFNQRATFELMAVAYNDSQDDAMQRYRRAVLTVKGNVPVTRLAGLPSGMPRAKVETL